MRAISREKNVKIATNNAFLSPPGLCGTLTIWSNMKHTGRPLLKENGPPRTSHWGSMFVDGSVHMPPKSTID